MTEQIRAFVPEDLQSVERQRVLRPASESNSGLLRIGCWRLFPTLKPYRIIISSSRLSPTYSWIAFNRYVMCMGGFSFQYLPAACISSATTSVLYIISRSSELKIYSISPIAKLLRSRFQLSQLLSMIHNVYNAKHLQKRASAVPFFYYLSFSYCKFGPKPKFGIFDDRSIGMTGQLKVIR